MEKNKPAGRMLDVRAIIIGDRAVSHSIRVVGDDRSPNIIAEEFLKRQYPREFKDICDIEGKFK